MKIFFLSMIGVSMVLHAGLSKSGDIVTDSTTQLQWQDNAIGAQQTWHQAIAYCQNLSLEGHNDWRLPNLKELTSIIEYTKHNPALDTTFENVASNYYWSSTTHAGNSSDAWRVRFYDGVQYYGAKSGSLYVRCVRAGQ